MEQIKILNEDILSGNFEKASKIVSQLSLDFFTKKIVSLAYKNTSLVYYSFVQYLIAKNECADYHSIASQLLSTSLCLIKGAYTSAYFHALRAIEIEPQNIKHKEFLLFFYKNPENVLSIEIAMKTANEILAKDPENEVAQEVLYEKVM